MNTAADDKAHDLVLTPEEYREFEDDVVMMGAAKALKRREKDLKWKTLKGPGRLLFDAQFDYPPSTAEEYPAIASAIEKVAKVAPFAGLAFALTGLGALITSFLINQDGRPTIIDKVGPPNTEDLEDPYNEQWLALVAPERLEEFKQAKLARRALLDATLQSSSTQTTTQSMEE